MIRVSVLLVVLVLCLPVMLARSAQADTGITLLTASQNSQPKYFPPSNPQRGLCGDIYDYLRLRMARYGISLEDDRQPLPISRILDDVLTGRRHIYCGAGRNSERERLYHFSENPLYTVANILITHQDNQKGPVTLLDLAMAEIRIGTFANTSSARWLQKQPGLVVDENYTDLRAALQDVSTGSLQYFFYHDLGLDHLMRNTKGHKARKVARQYRTKFHWMLMTRKLPEPVLHLINREITAMIDLGVIEKIRQDYRP